MAFSETFKVISMDPRTKAVRVLLKKLPITTNIVVKSLEKRIEDRDALIGSLRRELHLNEEFLEAVSNFQSVLQEFTPPKILKYGWLGSRF